CPMPHAPCPMPHAPCPMPNAQCPMPHAQCPMPTNNEDSPNIQILPDVAEHNNEIASCGKDVSQWLKKMDRFGHYRLILAVVALRQWFWILRVIQ
nr:hypothetical protein [Nostoc sp. CreGUA01]